MKIIAVTAIAVALLASPPAAAAVVAITVTGTVNFGIDSNGVFGAAGGNLRDAAYRMDYAYDITNALDAGTTRQANGGTSFNRPSPIVRSDVTINGVTVSAADPYSATYARFLFPARSELNFGSNSFSALNGAYFSWQRADQGIPLPLDAPVNRLFDASDTLFSSFQRANATFTVFSYLQLRPQSIAIAPAAAAVPEPGVWSLMITGFGLVGIVARRRARTERRRAATVAPRCA